ncbi:OPT super [Malassezia sp. CBS 17886]|nr:OPT super [Malassezia sp. CBS 17886]
MEAAEGARRDAADGLDDVPRAWAWDDEFTPRALVAGGVVGALITFTNLYLGLQSGWISTMTLQGSLMGYALVHLAPSSIPLGCGRRLAIQKDLLSPRENVMIQTVASAIGCMPLVAGAVGLFAFYIPVLYALPLFDVLASHGDTLTRWGWWFTPSFSYIGQGMIMGFPTSLSMTFGAVTGWAVLGPMAHFLGWTEGEPLDATHGSRGWIIWISLAIMCAESFVSLGELVSVEFARDIAEWVRMAFGRRSDEHPHGRDWSARQEPGYTPLSGNEEGEGASAEHFLRGPAAHAAAGEAPLRPPFDAPGTGRGPTGRDGAALATAPTSWVVWGVVASSVVGVFAVAYAVGARIAPWATFLAYLLASLFSVLAVRALGETDLNPVSGIAKISQLIFGALQPRNVVANLVAGAVAESGAMQAGELMQDYKTGYLVGVAPWNQFRAQILGSLIGVAFTALGYSLYRAAYTIPGPQFPAPTAIIWLNLARLLNNGTLPTAVPLFMLIFGALFAASSSLRTAARTRRLAGEPPTAWSTFAALLPSGIAFAAGMMNTPNFSLVRLVGGAVAQWYTSRSHTLPSGTLPRLVIIVIASGFVLGEGAASIAGLFMASVHAKPLTCFGCRFGCAGGCSPA